MVDTITDVNGNQIQYDYEENWLPDEWYGHVVSYTSRITTSRTRPIQIRYNFTEPAPNADTRVNATAASKIEFVYTDTRVSQIKLYHLEATPYRIVDLVLDAAYYQEHQTCFDAKPDYEAYTLTVTGVRILNGDGSEALPETRFTYTPLRHIPEGNWYPTCFQFAHLTGVDNGYGGQVSFVYAPDGRFADTVKGNPEYAMSFIVQEVQYWDGVHANPARTAYSYSAPCYDQADGDPGPWDGAANCPSRPGLTDFTYPHGSLVGFDTTTAVHLDYDGQPVRTEVSSFWRGAGVGDDIRQRQGRPIQFQVYDTANNLVQQQKTFYGRDNGASFDFTYANRVCTSPYLHGSGEHCVNYTYGRQNDVQYGNLTQIQEEGDIGGETNRQRLVYREYYPNPTTWVVNKVAREAVFAASAGTTITPAVSQPEAETRYYYDGNRTSWEVSPTKGLLVKVESLQESEAPPTPPTSTATPTAAPTSTPLPTVTPTPSPTATVPPPAAPTNLYAAMAGDAVSLRWEYYGKVTEAVTFNVYRSLDFPVLLLPDNRIATGLTGWYFTDRKGKSSDYYVVTAVNSQGESLPSNTARADDGCINCFQTMSLENTPLNPYPSYIVTQRLTYTPNFGLVETVTDANNHVTSTSYDGTYSLYPVSVTNAANQTTSYAYYGLNYAFAPILTRTNSYAGLLAQVTDPNGFSTHYTYDPFGRLERVFRGWEEQGSDFGKPSTFYRYYDYGSNRLQTQPWMIFTWNKTQDNAPIASTGGTWERQFYDGFGNLIQTHRPHTDWGGSGSGQEVVTDMRYDSQGHLLEQSAPRFAPAYVYELIGGLIKNPYKTPDFSNKIVSQYSATGDLVRQVGLDGAVSSAISGRRSLYQQDANNNLRASFFDATGQLAAVDEMLAGFSDNFDDNNPALPGWAKSGSVAVSSGRVHITGAGNYAAGVSRPLPVFPVLWPQPPTVTPALPLPFASTSKTPSPSFTWIKAVLTTR